MHFTGKLSRDGKHVADVSGVFTRIPRNGIAEWRGSINQDLLVEMGAEYDLTTSTGRTGKIVIEQAGSSGIVFFINAGLP